MIRFIKVGPNPDSGPLYASDDRTLAYLQKCGHSVELATESITNGTLAVFEPSQFDRLLDTIDALLGENGCPWDKAQTHESLRPYLLEEAYEAVDAIDRGDLPALKDELGDVLLQPYLHGQISKKAGSFGAEDIARALNEKLIRRHPHVFGDGNAETPEEVLQNWDAAKKQERPGEISILDSIPHGFPALMRAQKVSRKVAKVGFEWPDLDAVLDKVTEEIGEIRASTTQEEREAEFGDLLFTIVNVARWMKIDSETALAAMVTRFEQRFRWMEAHAPVSLEELTAEQWEELWLGAKRSTKS